LTEGYQFLHAGDESGTGEVDEKDWLRQIIGFDAVMNQPNMLIGWIAGPPAKWVFELFLYL
jgi:hypothetical protein